MSRKNKSQNNNKKTETQTFHLTVVTVVKDAIKHGRQQQLANCIASVAMQTFSNIEHLFIDGLSTDGTVEYIQSLAPTARNLRMISEKDRGIYDAMNKGFRNANGEYVVFLNSDDAFLYNDSVEQVMKKLTEENADYSVADAEVYSEDNSQYLYTWAGLPDNIIFGVYPCHQTLFCRKKVLDEIGGLSEEYLANDNLSMCRLHFGRWKGIYVNVPIVAFHLGGFSQTMQQKTEALEEEHIKFLTELSASGIGYWDAKWFYGNRYFYKNADEMQELVQHVSNEKIRNFVRDVYLQYQKEQQAAAPQPANQAVEQPPQAVEQLQVVHAARPTVCKLRLFGILPFCAFPLSDF